MLKLAGSRTKNHASLREDGAELVELAELAEPFEVGPPERLSVAWSSGHTSFGD
jgi:hypothetical protein